MHITHSNGSLKCCDDLNVIRKLSHAFFIRSFDCFQNSEPPQFNNQNNHWEKRISISSLVHSYLFLLLFSSFFLVIFGVYFFSASLFWFNECITIQCLLTKRTFYKFNSVAKDKKKTTHIEWKKEVGVRCVYCVCNGCTNKRININTCFPQSSTLDCGSFLLLTFFSLGRFFRPERT